MSFGQGFRQGCYFSPILFTSYSEYLTKEAVEGFGDFKVGQVIRTMKYADKLLLLSKKEAALQGMTEILIDTGICYGMEMNIKNTKIIRISMQPFPLQIMIDQKQLRLIRNDARCIHEIKSRIAMAKAAFNMKKNLFTRKLDSNLR